MPAHSCCGLGGAAQVLTGVAQVDVAGAKEQRLFKNQFQAVGLQADCLRGQVRLFGCLIKTAQAGGGFKATQAFGGGQCFR